MNSRIHIQSELEEINSSLPFNVKMPVFNVPEGYFESFANDVLAKVKGKQAVSVSDELSSISPLLAGISRKMPFSVPDNYFEEGIFPPSITGEEDNLPEVLSAAGKLMPYEVPAGYFDRLPQQILQKVAEKPSAKVVSFNRSWMRYAAAAVLIGFVALLGFFYLSGNKTIDPAKQPEAWIARKLKNISNQELEEFIKTASVINGTEMAKKEVKGNGKYEVEKLLQDVSDTELDAFLKQVPSGVGEEPLIN
jgi:hypothetical protein